MSNPTIEAEQAVLGSILLSPQALTDTFEILEPSDFRDPRHETIAEAARALARSGVVVDSVTLADALLSNEAGRKIPLDYLHELTSAPSSATLAGHYATIVKKHSGQRTAHLASQVLAQGVSEGREVSDLLTEITGMLEGAVDYSAAPEPISATLADVLDELGRAPEFKPTPWPHLDSYIYGLMPGCVTVIAARPGSGKTMMGLQLAVEMSKHGQAAFVSLEMPRKQLTRRLIASQSRVSLNSMMKSTVSADEWEKIRSAYQIIDQMPLFVHDKSGATFQQIEAFARRLARTGKLSVLVVDYLGLIPSTDPRKPRWEHIGDLSQQFKILAKDLNVPVVLLSQLNRESETNKRLPTLADLRDSGSIEQDADAVVLLQRRSDKEGNNLDVLDVIVAKSRHGQTGRLELDWYGKYATVETPKYGVPGLDYQSRIAGDD